MHLRKKVTGLLAGAGMLILILDSETALSGAAAGIELCLKTVIPALFPFLFLCSLLTGTLWGGQASVLEKAAKKLGIPKGAESILISAVLGGYPAGAQIIGSAYRSGTLSDADARHLLTFCSNAGPAFLFGMTSALFPGKEMVWALWGILLLSAALTVVSGQYCPAHPAKLPESDPSVPDLLIHNLRIMASICGWVMLFRIFSAFLERWVLFAIPKTLQIIITGLLELSNGCCSLSQIESVPLRFVICSIFLSFGGLCVTMQTLSVLGKLSPVSYLTGKLRQTAFTLVLSFLYLHLGWPILLMICLILWIFPVQIKKEVDFRPRRVYNTAITTGRK